MTVWCPAHICHKTFESIVNLNQKKTISRLEKLFKLFTISSYHIPLWSTQTMINPLSSAVQSFWKWLFHRMTVTLPKWKKKVRKKKLQKLFHFLFSCWLEQNLYVLYDLFDFEEWRDCKPHGKKKLKWEPMKFWVGVYTEYLQPSAQLMFCFLNCWLEVGNNTKKNQKRRNKKNQQKGLYLQDFQV